MDEFKKLGSLSPTQPGDWQKMASALDRGQNSQPYAASRAGLMFACYRKAEATDPEMYAAAVTAVLSDYPQEVIDYITDPRTGLPVKSKWLPTVFEVKQACDEHQEYLRKIELVRAKRAAQGR
jgi:hypothetical protein